MHSNHYRSVSTFSLRPNLAQLLHIDIILLFAIVSLLALSFANLWYLTQNPSAMSLHAMKAVIALFFLFLAARINPARYYQHASSLYFISILFLVFTLLIGRQINGAYRWLGSATFNFQPSEILFITLPLYLCHYFERANTFKLNLKILLIILIPFVLIAIEPDLGTAMLLLFEAIIFFFLAGIQRKTILATLIILLILTPLLWQLLAGYQQARIQVFMNLQQISHTELQEIKYRSQEQRIAAFLDLAYLEHSELLQAKQNIVKSGWGGIVLQDISPQNFTHIKEEYSDFLFMIFDKNFGFSGCFLIISLYLLILYRGYKMTISIDSERDRLLLFTLLGGFYIQALCHMLMNCAFLPFAGISLPLIATSGTLLLVNLLMFGIILSLATHRSLNQGLSI